MERGNGYLCSIFLGRDGAFWLLSAVDIVARVDNNAGLIRKFRNRQSTFLGQQCSNSQRSYMAVEEFNGDGQRDLFSILKARRGGVGVGLWRCYGICCLLLRL